MNDKALRILEFHKITERLAEHAATAPGRKLCENLRPSVVLSTIEKEQALTDDAVSRILRLGTPGFGGNIDPEYMLKALKVESTLSAHDLLRLCQLCETADRARNFGTDSAPAPGTETSDDGSDLSKDTLSDLFDGLYSLKSLSSEIRRCILSEDEIADEASPELSRIRRSIRVNGDKIQSQLRQMLNGSYRTYLQEAVITQRNNRYCLPVKAEYKGAVPGMIHDQSSSGSTLFIEPAAIVSLNNTLKELAGAEKEEIERILASLSKQAGEYLLEIAENCRILTQLDFVFAKGALALDMKASRPRFNEEGRICIRKGVHPLLPRDSAVPIDLPLGDSYDLLIVTGPNTGGKTVSLKTAGLLTLMGQAGLQIPASDGSELAVFREVFADIGDEQSIEQSLSTFSGHMTHIVQILKQADAHSLCLFDELGAGTDPEEGAALALSILESLHRKGIRTMATTHYSELKVYALSTPGVENASCEFDVETLRPTYRLLIGIPGKSNAFAISSKLGLPAAIIEDAKIHIKADKTDFEDLLADIEKSRRKMEEQELETRISRDEAEQLRKQLEKQQRSLDEQRERILEKARQEARDILQEAKDEADETIRYYRKAGPGATMKELEAARDKIRRKVDAQNQKLTVAPKKDMPTDRKIKPEELKIGDAVHIVTMRLAGTVASLPDHRGGLYIQCGGLRIQANVKDLIRASAEEELSLKSDPSDKTKSKKGSGAGSTRVSKSLSVSPEINLLGKTTDEAIAVLDKYLDDAYLARLSSVRIVHGKGTGALRNAVHQHLRRVKYVESFRLGEHGEGDAGVTIAVFKS